MWSKASTKALGAKSQLTRAALTLLSTTALLLAGCGSAGKSTTSTPKSKSTPSDTSLGQRAIQSSKGQLDMFAPPASQSADAARAIVRVGSVPITGATYAHWTQALTPKISSSEEKSNADCSSRRAPTEVGLSKQALAKLSSAQVQALCVRNKQAEVKQSALAQLISYQWVIGEASELGVGVSEAEAEHRLQQVQAQQFKSRAEFLEYLAATGRTPSDANLAIRLEMATERIYEVIHKRAAAKVTDASIARYYQTHKSNFEVPETRDIRAIRTWTRSAIDNAMAEVRSGKSIADVARRVSIDKPSNEHGGLIAGISRSQEEKGLDEAIFAAKLNQLTGPLHLRKRYYAFEVVKIAPGRIKPYKQIEAQVREALANSLYTQERASFVRTWRKKWLARTSCEPGYVVSRCRQWRGPSVLATADLYVLD